MSTALWFGQPVDVLDYSTDPDVGQVARVRTSSGHVRRVPVYDLEGAEGVPTIKRDEHPEWKGSNDPSDDVIDACPSWCNAHYTDDDEGYPIHKRVVTVGEASVDIETSPEWGPDNSLPIVPPVWNECDAAAARDLAAALIEAARLIEDSTR